MRLFVQSTAAFTARGRGRAAYAVGGAVHGLSQAVDTLRHFLIGREALVLGFLPTLAAIAFFWFSLPAQLFAPVWSTVVLDRQGRVLSASIAKDGQWRFPGDADIPARFAAALLAWEDKRFLRHPGVDPVAMGRALVTNIRRGRIVSGGSTLTMQVIRLSRPGRPRTVGEKLVEAVLALRLEMTHTKKEILRLFASNAPFGGNVVGFEAASWRWFGRDPHSLSWAESALLAVLPNSPGLVHPGANRDTLLARRNRLLRILRENGTIDESMFRLALVEPLPPQPFALPRHAPHLLDRVREAGISTPDGARVRTTLDYGLQLGVNGELLDRSLEWKEMGVASAAVLVVAVDTGDVLAYSGNIPVQGEQPPGAQVDLVVSPRSTGSLLKPFLYASVLTAGELLPDQLVPDIPTRIGSFMPENSTRTFTGAVPASAALARSLNVPAVRMLRSFGQGRFYDILKRLGLSTLSRPAGDYGLTLILGGAEGTLWDLVGMYASLARCAKRAPGTGSNGEGAFFPPRFVEAHRAGAGPQAAPGGADQSGVGQSAKSRSVEASPIGPGAAWLTLTALLEVERPGEEGAWRDYLGSRRIAWKTGTSYGNRDAWAIGVTPKHAVGVWVGNASGEGRPELRGASVAAPVLFDVFGMLPDSGWFQKPDADLIPVTVCARSGLRAGSSCQQTKVILAPPKAETSDVCGYCRLVHLERTGRFRATTRTEPVGSLKAVPWFVLPPAMEWFYARTHSDYRPLPPWKPGSEDFSERKTSPNLSLMFPEQGGKIYIPIELDGHPGKTVFRAAHRNPRATIFWHLDEAYLGETTEIHDMEARPGPGPHTLTLVDERGEEVVRTFTCLSEK